MDSFFEIVTQGNVKIDKFISLSSLYKTNYSTTDTGYYQGECVEVIRYYKTSHSKNHA